VYGRAFWALGPVHEAQASGFGRLLSSRARMTAERN
jgi:hypothetical protein